jgi:hypothetical protein
MQQQLANELMNTGGEEDNEDEDDDGLILGGAGLGGMTGMNLPGGEPEMDEIN